MEIKYRIIPNFINFSILPTNFFIYLLKQKIPGSNDGIA